MSPIIAAQIAVQLEKHFPVDNPTERHLRNALALAEETGELIGAIRRYLGLARRPGTLTDVAHELADVHLTCYLIAHYLGIDLPAAAATKLEEMFARGFKNYSPGENPP
jgi:NTP pyrophosphatase (non-canonical NTP hydrolase)